MEFDNCIYCGSTIDIGTGFQCIGPCKKVQHFKCRDDKNYDSHPIYFRPIDGKASYCCSVCIDNFDTNDFARLSFSDEKISLKDLYDSVSNIRPIITLLTDLQTIAVLSILGIHKWSNKSLELINFIKNISTKLSFDAQMIIAGKYMLVLESFEMQRHMFKEVEDLMLELKKDSVDLEKTYLDLKNTSLSLSEMCRNEVRIKTRKLKFHN